MKTKLFSLTVPFWGTSLLFADGSSPLASGDNNIYRTLMFFGIVLTFFYLILWRPEQKRRKKLEAQRNALKPGDRVIAMGIIGEVFKIEDQTVILKMYDGTKIEMLKGAITGSSAETVKEKPSEREPQPVKS